MSNPAIVDVLVSDLVPPSDMFYIRKDVLDNILLKAGVDARDANGNTPLHLCSNLEVAKTLCNKGANLEARDKEQNTPLHNCFGRNVKVLQYLVEKGADIEARNVYDETPLQTACRFGDLETVRMFLYHGANPTVTNGKGQLALEIAIEEDYVDIINELFPYLDDYILQEMDISERSLLLVDILSSCSISNLLACMKYEDPEALMAIEDYASDSDFFQIFRKCYYNLSDCDRLLDLLREHGDSRNVSLNWNELSSSTLLFHLIVNLGQLVERRGIIPIMYSLLSFGAPITEEDFMLIVMTDDFTKHEKFEFLSIAIRCSAHDLPIFDIPEVLSIFAYSRYLLAFSSRDAEEILNHMLKYREISYRAGVLKCIYHLMKHARITKELEDNYGEYFGSIIGITKSDSRYHEKILLLLKVRNVPSLLQISANVVRKQVAQGISKPQGLKALFFAICELEIPRHLRDTLMHKDIFVS